MAIANWKAAPIMTVIFSYSYRKSDPFWQLTTVIIHYFPLFAKVKEKMQRKQWHNISLTITDWTPSFTSHCTYSWTYIQSCQTTVQQVRVQHHWLLLAQAATFSFQSIWRKEELRRLTHVPGQILAIIKEHSSHCLAQAQSFGDGHLCDVPPQ